MFSFAKIIVAAAIGLSGLAAVAQAQALNLTSSQWIWTNEATGNTGNFPAGHRAFRKDFDATFLKFPSTVEVLMAADNEFLLYVNGILALTGTDFNHANYTCVDVSHLSNIVLAVDVNNDAGTGLNPAGLIATVRVNYEIGDPDEFVTDSSWVYDLTVPVGFQDPSFDDSTWPESVGEGLYGVAPWGRIGIPPASSQVCSE